RLAEFDALATVHLSCFETVRTAAPSASNSRVEGARAMADVLKILAIDGGGIRGVIPATILSAIEERTETSICKLFDLVAGTSTGGILALGLVKPSAGDEDRPQYKAADLAELYEKEGKRIFDR